MNPAAGRVGKVLLSGYFVFMVIFLYVPLVVLVVFAFNDAYIPSLPFSGFTTKWFSAAFDNIDLTGALKRSAWLALVNGLAATFLGVFAALALTGRKLYLRSVWTTLLLLPLVVPYIVLAIGMVIVLHQLGYQASLTAVLAGHIVISLPYAILVIVPRLRTLDESVVEAARDLGADQARGVHSRHPAAAHSGAGCERLDLLHDLVRRVRDRVVSGASGLAHLSRVPVLRHPHPRAPAAGDRAGSDRDRVLAGAGRSSRVTAACVGAATRDVNNGAWHRYSYSGHEAVGWAA